MKNNNPISELLTKGLQGGFAGGTVLKGINRGSFAIESSHAEIFGGIYHDEWMASRAGGGQELVRIGNKIYTRVYAGGTIQEEELKRLGITEKEVTVFLKSQMIKNGDKIRLHSNFESEEGDWKYKYQILEKEEKIPMTTGKETIYFKGELVFQHNFILSPVD